MVGYFHSFPLQLVGPLDLGVLLSVPRADRLVLLLGPHAAADNDVRVRGLVGGGVLADAAGVELGRLGMDRLLGLSEFLEFHDLLGVRLQ